MTRIETVSLEQFCQIVQGGRLKLSGRDFVQNGVPAYGAGGLNGYVQDHEFEAPAVILSSIGARCGKCFYAEGKWTSLANTQLIFPDPSRADCRFLWFQLNDERRWHRSGTGQPFIKPADVKSHKVYLPPLPEQQRIAEVLDRAEALRAKRRAALVRIDMLTQAIFFEMFGDSTTNSKGWPVRELQAVVREGTIVTYGIVQAGEEFPGGVPYIRTGDIVDGEIAVRGLRHTDPEIAARFARSTVREGEIVMSIRATVGTTAFVPPELDGANLTQGTARIAPGIDVDRWFLLNFLRSPSCQAWIGKQIKGATFREITLARLRQLPVYVPPLELQQEFARRAAAVERLKATQRASLAKLDALFASLQHRAFRGEL